MQILGDLDIQGGTVFDRHVVTAGDSIEIDASGNTFVEINDDGGTKNNLISFVAR